MIFCTHLLFTTPYLCLYSFLRLEFFPLHLPDKVLVIFQVLTYHFTQEAFPLLSQHLTSACLVLCESCPLYPLVWVISNWQIWWGGAHDSGEKHIDSDVRELGLDLPYCFFPECEKWESTRKEAVGSKDLNMASLISHANTFRIHFGGSRGALNSFKQEDSIIHCDLLRSCWYHGEEGFGWRDKQMEGRQAKCWLTAWT